MPPLAPTSIPYLYLSSNSIRLTTYTGVHSAAFRDLLLKPQLQRSIVDCGFEHPSEVQ